MPKTRLDLLLVERGLVESRSLAQRLVMAGQVRVDGQVALKPATQVEASAELLIERGARFVSRGGEKLAAALDAFQVEGAGRVCADVGASTGGFTDCLLQAGAAKVYAVDVGQGLLHWKLRQDKRVVVMEGRNARHLDALPEAVDVVTIDASFISLKVLLPVVHGWVTEDSGEVLALIKPQFEAGVKDASKGKGVIKDPLVHEGVLAELLNFTQRQGYEIQGLMRSPLPGAKGNVEFFVHLNTQSGEVLTPDQIDDFIKEVVDER